MPKEDKTILEYLEEFLPKSLIKNYSLEKILTVNNHNTIIMLSSKESEENFVLKILEKDYYNTSLAKSLHNIQKQNYLFPILTMSDSSFFYLLYPYKRTLSDALLQEGLNYPMIYRLVTEIGNAVAILHKHNILHLDITPDNIFLDKNYHFYLGDFSSSCLAKKKYFTYNQYKCQRTGTTPAFAPPNAFQNNTISFWNDQYSFSMLIYILLNDGELPSENSINKYSQFPSVTHILQKSLVLPSAISKDIFPEFLCKLEHALEKEQQHTDYKNYQIKLKENHEIIHNAKTPSCKVEKTNLSQIKPSSKQPNTPVLLYGLLICCGLLFLFSLYHYLAQTSKNDKRENSVISASNLPGKESNPTASVSDYEDTKNLMSENPINPSNIPKETPSSKLRTNDSKKFKKSILNISGSNYYNDSFLNNSDKPESIKILIANSCQFPNSQPFSKLKNLEELYLYNNPLTSVTGLSKLKYLKTLILSKCKLNDISCLAKLKNLTILDLSQNKKIKKVYSLSALINLEYLVITHTNISQEDIRLLQKKLPHCTILY